MRHLPGQRLPRIDRYGQPWRVLVRRWQDGRCQGCQPLVEGCLRWQAQIGTFSSRKLFVSLRGIFVVIAHAHTSQGSV